MSEDMTPARLQITQDLIDSLRELAEDARRDIEEMSQAITKHAQQIDYLEATASEMQMIVNAARARLGELEHQGADPAAAPIGEGVTDAPATGQTPAQ